MRTLARRAWSPRAAFTLVEAAVSIALLGLLMSSAILVAKGGQGAFRATQNATDVETRVRRALDRMVMELLSAGNLEPIAPLLGSSAVIYSLVRPWDWNKLDASNGAGDGVVGLTPLWGLRNSLAFEQEPGETDNGLDDDGDGLVDEGCVVLTVDLLGTPRQAILCSGVRELGEGESANGVDDNGNGVVDEGGFNVLQDGEVLFLRLSVEEPGEGGSIVRTLETSVRVRN